MNSFKVLKQEEFYFRILVDSQSEYFGLEGLYNLTTKLPSTVTPIAVKESSPLCKVYCITNNHSDYMGIESRLNVKTEMM
jgi:hypothetical protein